MTLEAGGLAAPLADCVPRGERIGLEGIAASREVHPQHCNHLGGPSSEQKRELGFADSRWHVLLTLYVHLQLRHTSRGLILDTN